MAEIPCNLRIVDYSRKITTMKCKAIPLFSFIFIPRSEKSDEREEQ